MKNFINSVFLISGTAIGAGLIALPLVAVNVGNLWLFLGMSAALFVAYYSSYIVIYLSKENGRGSGIAELSQLYSGRYCFAISILSFYILSFSLLSVYFSGAAEVLESFFNIDARLIALICAFCLYAVIGRNLKSIGLINSIMVVILMISICFVIINVFRASGTVSLMGHGIGAEIRAFVPIVFTSFGIQNIAPHVFDLLDGNISRIKKAFIIGATIPFVIYVLWILSVIISVKSNDYDFFIRMQNHQVSAGELVTFLCNSSKSTVVALFFKILTFFAIATSAIGIGLGLLRSIKECTKINKKAAALSVSLIPAAAVIFIPNSFVKILSFGAMIATVFVIFVPYYLLFKNKRNMALNPQYIFCLIFGIVVVICELF